MSDELKPCPFCGGRNWRKGVDDDALIECNDCGVKVLLDFRYLDTTNWNSRPIEDAIKHDLVIYRDAAIVIGQERDTLRAALAAATARAESAEAERNELRLVAATFRDVNNNYFAMEHELATANERARLAEAVCELDALDTSISFAEWCNKHNGALAAWQAAKEAQAI
jgi:hypothetical protein